MMLANGTPCVAMTTTMAANMEVMMSVLEQIGEKRPTVLSGSYGRRRYLIGIGDIGTHYYLVWGDCLQDAIDFIVDLDGDNVPGFFADEDTVEAYWNEDHTDHLYAQESFLSAGNAGDIFTNEIHIVSEDTRRWR